MSIPRTRFPTPSQINTTTVTFLVFIFVLIHSGNTLRAFKDPVAEYARGAELGQLGSTHPNSAYYVKGNTSTYLVVSTESNYWQGSVYCANLGGALVSIETREEDEEVAALIPDAFFEHWTSGLYASNTGNYHWATGEEVTYTNFESGMGVPPVPGEAISMLAIKSRGNKWHSHQPNTNTNVGFICEFGLEEPTTISPTTTTTTVQPPTTTIYTTTLRTTTQNAGGCSNFQCPFPNGNFADPNNCAAYYSCAGGLCVGHFVCPDGLLFNPDRQICDYPSEVDCDIK